MNVETPDPQRGDEDPGRTVEWLERAAPGLVKGLVIALVVIGLLYLATRG